MSVQSTVPTGAWARVLNWSPLLASTNELALVLHEHDDASLRPFHCPDDLAARRYAQNCRDVLTQMFAARIGPLDQVITVVVSPEEVQWLSLDHRAGFLLSLVDGMSTVDEILDISGMTRLDALKILHDLTEQQVVKLA